MVSGPLLPHVRRARDLVDQHYAEALDLDALAAAAGVSKYHLARCFAEIYGETPIRYLSRRRIERAQDLLRSANLTVTEVCVLVGFSSLGSFSSRFRQLVASHRCGIETVGSSREARSFPAASCSCGASTAGPDKRAIWEKRAGWLPLGDRMPPRPTPSCSSP